MRSRTSAGTSLAPNTRLLAPSIIPVPHTPFPPMPNTNAIRLPTQMQMQKHRSTTATYSSHCRSHPPLHLQRSASRSNAFLVRAAPSPPPLECTGVGVASSGSAGSGGRALARAHAPAIPPRICFPLCTTGTGTGAQYALQYGGQISGNRTHSRAFALREFPSLQMLQQRVCDRPHEHGGPGLGWPAPEAQLFSSLAAMQAEASPDPRAHWETRSAHTYSTVVQHSPFPSPRTSRHCGRSPVARDDSLPAVPAAALALQAAPANNATCTAAQRFCLGGGGGGTFTLIPRAHSFDGSRCTFVTRASAQTLTPTTEADRESSGSLLPAELMLPPAQALLNMARYSPSPRTPRPSHFHQHTIRIPIPIPIPSPIQPMQQVSLDMTDLSVNYTPFSAGVGSHNSTFYRSDESTVSYSMHSTLAQSERAMASSSAMYPAPGSPPMSPGLVSGKPPPCPRHSRVHHHPHPHHQHQHQHQYINVSAYSPPALSPSSGGSGGRSSAQAVPRLLAQQHSPSLNMSTLRPNSPATRSSCRSDGNPISPASVLASRV